MREKKGYGFLIYLLVIYLVIGFIIYLWAGLKIQWWSLENLLLWPKLLIEAVQYGNPGVI